MSNVVFSIGTDDKLNMSLDDIVKKGKQLERKKKDTGSNQKNKNLSVTRRQASGKVISAVRRERAATAKVGQRRNGPAATPIKRNSLRQPGNGTPTAKRTIARPTIARKSPTAKVVNIRSNRLGGLARRGAGTADGQARPNGNNLNPQDIKITIDNASVKSAQELRRPGQRGNVKQNTTVVRNPTAQVQQKTRAAAQRLLKANTARQISTNNNTAPARQAPAQNIKMTLSERFAEVKQPVQNPKPQANRQFGNNVIRKPGFRNNSNNNNRGGYNAGNGGAQVIRKPGIDDRNNGDVARRINRRRF